MDPFTLALIASSIGAAGSAYSANKAEKSAKASRRQLDVISQQEETRALFNSMLSLVIPGSDEYIRLLTEGSRYAEAGNRQGLLSLGSELARQQGTRVAGGGAATPFEARTDLAFGGYRKANVPAPEEQAILNALLGLTSGGTPSDAIFGETVARAQDPNRFYESTLAPQLQLAEDVVRRRAASRGVLGSGLELEDLGRTGADLAIREADARERFRQQQLQNFGEVYNLGQGLREREIGVEANLTNLQLGRETNLQSSLASRASSAERVPLDIAQRRTSSAEGRSSDAEDFARALNAQFSQSLGELGGTAVNYFLPGAGGLPTGSPASFTTASGYSAPISVDETLALNRAGFGNQTQVNNRRLIDLLSRSSGGY